MSILPEVEPGIREAVRLIFRSQGPLREYFTDIHRHIGPALQKFNLQDLWLSCYEQHVVDFEVDRAELFLSRLMKNDRPRFVSFLDYIVNQVHLAMHVPIEEIEDFLKSLETLGLKWNGQNLVDTTRVP